MIMYSFFEENADVLNGKTLFAGLQFETSIMVGLPLVIVLELQNSGGAIDMIRRLEFPS